MAQMERSAKKLPANLANRDFKAEIAKAKTPAEKEKLLRMRDTKLSIMKKMGDSRAATFAKGDERERSEAMKKAAAPMQARKAAEKSGYVGLAARLDPSKAAPSAKKAATAPLAKITVKPYTPPKAKKK